MSDPISNFLFTQGVLGVALVVVSGVLIFIYKTKEAEVKQERIKNESIQEQRITDAKETRDAIVEPLKELAKQSDRIYDVLVRGRGN